MSQFQISDHQLVRNYVTALDHLQYQSLPEGVVAVMVTHSNLPQKLLDLRFDLHNTIEAVKEKLYTHVGTPVCHQRLILKSDGKEIVEMIDNNRMLGFYSVESGMEIHIIDTDPFSLSRGGGLTDVSLVEKYRMSDEDYDKRKGSLREFMKQKKAENPKFKLTDTLKKTPMFGGPAAVSDQNEDTANIPPPGPESVVDIAVGMRCEVTPGARRGLVKFLGELEGMKPGYWVGIEFDEPVGLCDGKVKGVQIFECKPSHGSFVRGKNVSVGDYPERDLFAESDEENDEDCCGKHKSKKPEDEEEDEI